MVGGAGAEAAGRSAASDVPDPAPAATDGRWHFSVPEPNDGAKSGTSRCLAVVSYRCNFWA